MDPLVLRGINSINIDEKGRLAVPMRYRKSLVEQFLGRLVITIDTNDPCLLIYPEYEWNQIQKKIERLPSFHPATRRIQRLLIGHATDVIIDTNGRILISSLLREYASLTKSCILLGQGNKFELWSEDSWKTCRDQYLQESEKIDDIPIELQEISL